MAFALDDQWIWDFWIARDGGDYHLFFLQAPRAIGDPEKRHWHATVGHAVSTDLRAWTNLGACFGPAPAPAWDDGTTWTGSVFRHAGLWHYFYTGTSRGEDCRKQRIGLATSADLHTWRRHPGNPVLDLDPALYEEYDPAVWHDRAFRDPWVAPDPGGRGFRMWFTARAPDGPADGRGVIGTARSDDLLRWKVEAPLTPPGDFGECEVPQFVAAGGRAYLLFCTSGRRTSAVRRRAVAARGEEPETGTHYYVADRAEGPWRLAPGRFLSGSLYAGRLIDGPDGRLYFLGSVGERPDCGFVGAISDPIPVAFDGNGMLALEREPAMD